MRDFVEIDLGREPVTDETTVCRFRQLLETYDLGRRLFDEVQRHLAANGLNVATGTHGLLSMRSLRSEDYQCAVLDQERRQNT
jgi:IS5 family transposase